MNVKQLIELLQGLPQDLPVGYVNECADEGHFFVEITDARIRQRPTWGPARGQPALSLVLE